ncbi:hypothetical protein [Kitasatospora sp. GP82]|uniref:hypothetical protein n=1 Tax=Kitasatospora sp. GP82 TaxID=3035089 RepID=UPI00247457B8|nr:hypothetical protein [Kitasatospora sp. GP82]MDH6130351.1 hypothetical protein [Kitasatospora sp. GP82]
MPTITAADLRRLLDSGAENPVLYIDRDVDDEPELNVWAAAYVDKDDIVITRDALIDWLGDDWTDKEIAEYLPELQDTVDGIEPEPGPHFTVWLTTTSGELEGDESDVAVLADKADSWKQGKPDWASTGDPLFHALAGIHARDGDAEEAQSRAEQILAEAGWQIAGDWKPVDTGCVAVVERVDAAEQWTLAEVAERIQASSTKYADVLLRRWGVKATGRQPGRGGQNLYPAVDVLYAYATRPGQGTRTDLKDAQ